MNNKRGFTLIEIMVAMTILVVLLGFGVSMMGAKMQHYRLKNATREMITSLRKDAQLAVNQNTNRTVTFTDNTSPTSDRYTIGGGTPVNIDLPNDVRFGVRGANAPVNGTSDVAGASIPSDGITFSGNTVTFQTNRTPDEAGEIYLSNSRGENVAVSINLVGRIRCWKWGDGSVWKAC